MLTIELNFIIQSSGYSTSISVLWSYLQPLKSTTIRIGWNVNRRVTTATSIMNMFTYSGIREWSSVLLDTSLTRFIHFSHKIIANSWGCFHKSAYSNRIVRIQQILLSWLDLLHSLIQHLTTIYSSLLHTYYCPELDIHWRCLVAVSNSWRSHSSVFCGCFWSQLLAIFLVTIPYYL